MKLKNKLHRMRHHLSTPSTSESDVETNEENKQQKEEAMNTPHTIPFMEEWKNQSANAQFLEDQYTIKREVHYPFEHKHGKYILGELHDVCSKWQHETAFHPLHPEKRKPEDFLFFDTETTGLNNGAGNMIFLLGSASFTSNEVKVTQYFLPGPDAEVAFYYYFLKDTTSTQNLVTYNGKAFDWPQLKTRHTFVRQEVPKLPSFGHFDLLHAVRRLFKHRLPSCKLSIVEKEILGFERIDDTPGYLAPMLYFDFMKEKHPSFVKGVMRHNEWDVLSLITLYIDLSKRVLEENPSGREIFEIGRWYEQCKEWKKAEWCYRQAVYHAQESWLPESYYYLAHALKKQKRIEEAYYYFKQVLKVGETFQREALVELAKYYEHHKKDPEKALSLTKKALEITSRPHRIGELETRMERLLRKVSTGK